MKQYFTGFFTATCLFRSIIFFIGASNKNNKIETNMITVKGKDGTTLIMDDTIVTLNKKGIVTAYFGNNMFKNGTIALFDKNGIKEFKK